ncbi:MAG: PAS domain S-box protein [Syntrophotaleaceae bacterium]
MGPEVEVSDPNRTIRIKAFRVAGIYALFGFIWILFSDQIILLFATNPDELAHLQTWKGWLFILVTAILLFFLVRLALKAQQKVEQILRQSEERLSATLASIGDGVISTDAAGRIVSLNRVAEVLTGWSSREAVGLPIEKVFSIVDFQTRSPLASPVERALQEDGTVDLGERTLLVARSGREVHIHDSCAPIRDVSGAAIGTVLVFRDCTREFLHHLQLQEERERLASVVWGTGVGTWEWDVTTGETIFNERWAEMAGYTLDEISPVSFNTFEKLLHPDDRIRVDEALQRHFRGETDYYECEFRMRHKGGRWIWVLDRGKVTVWTEDGQPRRMAGTHLEITDRKRAEEVLRRSEERIKSIFRVAPIGIGVVVDRVLLEVNQRICEMTGYQMEELVGRSARMLYPTSEDFERVGSDKYSQIKARGTGMVETRWQMKDGSIREILLSSTPLNPADLSQGVTFTALDITDKKRAEEALRESERKLSSLIGNLPGMAYRSKNGPDWAMEFLSGSEALTGYGPEELKENYAAIIHPEDRNLVWQEVQAALKKKVAFQVEYRIVTRGGEVHWVWEQGAGVFSEAGEVEALEGIIIDINDRKVAEKGLIESESRYRSLFQNNHAVMLIIDPDTGAVVDCNPAAEAWYGWTREEFCRKNIQHINSHSEKELQAEISRTQSLVAGYFVFQHRRADGSLRDVEVFSGPVKVAGRQLLYSIVHDITEKKKFEEALEKRILALTRPLEDATDLTLEELFDLRNLQRLQDDFSLATGVASVIVTPDGLPVTRPSNFRRFCQDIACQSEKSQEQCYRSRGLLGQAGQQGPTIAKCFTANLWNAGAPLLVGGYHIATWVVGQVNDGEVDEDQLRVNACKMEVDKESVVEAFREIPVIPFRQFEQIAQTLFTLANQLSYSAYQNVQQARFITEQKQDRERIAFLAHHDQLTGLANRALFAERFEHAARHGLRTGTGMALCVLDLDGFKAINDSHGHPMGDQLLCEVANRLKTAVRASDTVGRIGGDEFVILFSNLKESGSVTTLMQKILLCFEQPFLLEGTLHAVTASMGIAMFPEDGQNFSTLFEHADSAMYFAKESGRNNVQFYREEINRRLQHRLSIEKDLRQALLEDQLELYFQPIIQLPEKRIAGMEALVRWRHPQKGMIPPGQFIPIAEESNLIVSLGQWVLYSACRSMAELRKMGLPVLPVSVNVSARQLFEKDFAPLVEKILADFSLPSEKLELEVTENIFLEDSTTVEMTMNRLKDLGVGLVLDDFGTGYSSLSILKRFRIDKLKIDRSFMEHACHNQQDASLVVTIIQMARNLGIQAVAEGVETGQQLNFLIEQGCELAQGFLFSKPLPFPDLREKFSLNGTIFEEYGHQGLE